MPSRPQDEAFEKRWLPFPDPFEDFAATALLASAAAFEMVSPGVVSIGTASSCASAWAREERIIGTNPALELRIGWGSSVRRRVLIPSIPQVLRLAAALDHFKPGLGDVAMVLAFTGLRWEEAVAVPVPVPGVSHGGPGPTTPLRQDTSRNGACQHWEVRRARFGPGLWPGPRRQAGWAHYEFPRD